MKINLYDIVFRALQRCGFKFTGGPTTKNKVILCLSLPYGMELLHEFKVSCAKMILNISVGAFQWSLAQSALPVSENHLCGIYVHCIFLSVYVNVYISLSISKVNIYKGSPSSGAFFFSKSSSLLEAGDGCILPSISQSNEVQQVL